MTSKPVIFLLCFHGNLLRHGPYRASLGGIIKTDRGNETREEGVDTELALFDQKVHRACIEMVDATTRELRNLDVPFFCKGFGDVTEEREKMAELRSQIVALLESYLKGGEEG